MDRRVFLATVGCALAAGCGADPTSPGPTTNPSEDPPAFPDPDRPLGADGGSDGSRACQAAHANTSVRAADLPVASAVVVGGQVVSRDEQGGLWTMTSACPHQGQRLEAKAGYLECPLHHSKFRLDGTYIEGPAARGLSAAPACVDSATGLVATGS